MLCPEFFLDFSRNFSWIFHINRMDCSNWKDAEPVAEAGSASGPASSYSSYNCRQFTVRAAGREAGSISMENNVFTSGKLVLHIKRLASIAKQIQDLFSSGFSMQHCSSSSTHPITHLKQQNRFAMTMTAATAILQY